MNQIAEAYHTPWIGWQELSASALPINEAESKALIEKLQNTPTAWSALAALNEKKKDYEAALRILSQKQLGDEHSNRHLWRSRLHHESGNLTEAAKALTEADQHFHHTRSPFEVLPIFISQARISLAMQKVDTYRKWLDWIINSDCSANLQWQAYQEMSDLDYHQQITTKRTLPPWVECMVAAEDQPLEATKKLAEGKSTWWQNLTWDQRCLLCENINNSSELCASLLPLLENDNQDKRQRILTTLLSFKVDTSQLTEHLFKNRILYHKLLPDLISIKEQGRITGYTLGRLALEEAENNPTDAARALFSLMNQNNFIEPNPTAWEKIWHSLEPQEIKFPEIVTRSSVMEMTITAKVAYQLLSQRDENNAADFLKSHPQADSIPSHISQKTKEIFAFYQVNHYKQNQDHRAAHRSIHDSLRMLQMFTSPDIARKRFVNSYFHEGVEVNSQWFFYRFTNDDTFFKMGSPIQHNEIIASRHIVKDAEVLAWYQILCKRLIKNTPLDNQRFLSEKLMIVRSEKNSGEPRSNFVPSNIYPAATRALMELQCNELFRKTKSQETQTLLKTVIKELPLIAIYLNSQLGAIHSIGYGSNLEHLLQEHYTQHHLRKIPVNQKKTEEIIKNLVLEYLMGEQSNNLKYAISNSPDPATTLGSIYSILKTFNSNDDWINRDLMKIAPDDLKIRYATSVAKLWPLNRTAMNIVAADAFVHLDRVALKNTLEAIINVTPKDFSLPEQCLELLSEENLRDLLELCRNNSKKGNAALHMQIAQGLFTITLKRHPTISEFCIDSLLAWFAPQDRNLLEQKLREVFIAHQTQSRHLGKYQSWSTKRGENSSNGILDTILADRMISPSIRVDWAYAKSNGQGEIVSELFKKYIERQGKIQANLLYGHMDLACRHADDELWSKCIKSRITNDRWLTSFDTMAIEAAQCYFDGCENRAIEWLDAMEKVMQNAPEIKEENMRYSRTTIAAEALATAWIWLGKFDRADKLKNWLQPLADQPDWDCFLRRNDELGDNIGIGSAIHRTIDGKWKIHWMISPANKHPSACFGMWPLPKLNNEWKLYSTLRNSANYASPTLIQAQASEGERRGAYIIENDFEEFASELRLSRGNQEWSTTLDNRSHDLPKTTFVKSVPLAPILLEKLKNSGLKVTNEDQGWVTGDQSVSGWVPAGGIQVFSFDAKLGDYILLSGFYAGLSHSALIVSSRPAPGTRRMSSDIRTCYGAAIDWFTQHRENLEISPASSPAQELRLMGPNKDGSGFVCMRMKDASLEFHKTILPKEIITLAVFPSKFPAVTISPQLELALASVDGELLSSRFTGNDTPITHALGSVPVSHFGFTSNYVIAVDRNSWVWVATPKELVFRYAGKIDTASIRINWNHLADSFAALGENNVWQIWSIKKDLVEYQSKFSLDENYLFRFTADPHSIILRNPRDQDVSILLNTKTGERKNELIPKVSGEMVKYYNNGNVVWLWQDRSPAPHEISQSVEEKTQELQKLIATWAESHQLTYTNDAKFLYICKNGMIRKITLPEIPRTQLKEK